MSVSKEDLAVGKRIKAIRKQLNMTTIEFGEMLNTSSSIVSRWENGFASPNFERLRIICIKANTTVDWIWFGRKRGFKYENK